MLAIPIALMVLIIVVDVLAPPFIHLGPLLVAAPALTASFAGPRMTGLIAALAVLAQAVIAVLRDRDELFSANHQAQIVALVLVGTSLVIFCTVRERREKELKQVRYVSETAQRLILRPLPKKLGPLRVASMYLAAEAEARVGGDLYAAARTGHQHAAAHRGRTGEGDARRRRRGTAARRFPRLRPPPWAAGRAGRASRRKRLVESLGAR